MHITLPAPWSSASTISTDWTLHQIAPYIGRTKTTIAKYFINHLSRPGDLIVDPFCGSGVIPLEAAASGRCIIAGDLNPYALALTHAKLFPPDDLDDALARLNGANELANDLVHRQDLRRVPQWVRLFFSRETLREALAWRDACIELGDTFLLACLLGILHHQRPGFLSYPSSHLVPYLRTKKFPRTAHPELYTFREVLPRMAKKIRRTLRRVPNELARTKRTVLHVDARSFPQATKINAVITSPPYMNELDYVRDNRLRIWFLLNQLPNVLELPRRGREHLFASLMETTFLRVANCIAKGGYIVLILGDVKRGGPSTHPALIVKSIFSHTAALGMFRLIEEYRDVIPDIRRSRREHYGTKSENILVFQRSG